MLTAGTKNQEFASPPVIETVLGVAFAPLSGWDIPHFGLYWATIKKEYPSFSVQPALLHTGSEARGSDFAHLIRCWFISKDETGLVQVQRDLFIRNWKKQEGGSYPRHEVTRPLFERDWVRFCAFLAREGLGQPEVRQCEVSYINHIPREEGSSSEVFPCLLGGSSSAEMPEPDGVHVAARYPMPDRAGYVSVVVQSAERAADRKKVFQMTVTAKGPPASSNLADIVSWFDKGREWANRAFISCTSDKMQAVWAGKNQGEE